MAGYKVEAAEKAWKEEHGDDADAMDLDDDEKSAQNKHDEQYLRRLEWVRTVDSACYSLLQRCSQLMPIMIVLGFVRASSRCS